MHLLTQKKLSHAKYADLELEADHIQLNGSRAESTARESHHNKHQSGNKMLSKALQILKVISLYMINSEIMN